MRSESSFLLFSILLLGAMFCVLGFHALVDPDLGWHLVGGEFMLHHRQLPERDPLGAESSVWIAYSWLPEILFSAVYSFAGFEGLRLLQLGCVLFTGFSVFAFFLGLVERSAGEGASRPNDSGTLSALLLMMLSLFFLAPMFHLRPQLLSVGFFALFLRELNRSSPSYWRMVIVSLLWVNTHVFWVFAPLTIFLRFLCQGQKMNAFLLPLLFLLLGVLSPYGRENISVIFHYAFAHSVAYGLLPISFGAVRERKQHHLFILAGLFALGTLLQRKYLPFFGVTASACLHLLLSRRLFSLREFGTFRFSARNLALLLVFFLLLPFLLERDSPLRASTEELLMLTRELPSPLPRQDPMFLYGGFDEGGWLGFSLYESGRSPGIKTLIDGRTLVMGEQRLLEYSRGIQSPGDFCKLLASWKADYAVLAKDSQAWKALQEKTNECQAPWRPIKLGSYWGLLQRVSIQEHPQAQS